MTIEFETPGEALGYVTEEKVQALSEQLEGMSRAQIHQLEEVIHDLPAPNAASQLDPDESFFAGENALLEIISKREFVVALANAGFVPPGSVEERKLVIAAFFDAVQRSKVLPYDSAREIAIAQEIAARAQLSYEQWITQVRIEQITRGGKIDEAEIRQEIATANARIELAESKAQATRRLNDVSDLESLERARQALFAERDELNRRNAAENQSFAEREATVAALERNAELQARERIASIYKQEQDRKDRLAARLPNFWNARRAKNGKA